jgi:hypothetical protein
MLRRIVIGGLMVLVIGATATAAHAGVSVNIGISVPAPPHFAVVPGTAVSYAPAVPANYFLYGGRYYVFANGIWYDGRGYNGPWAVVAPALVPRPLLAVPVRYYHAPPAHWKVWYRGAPPRWQHHWVRHEGPRHGHHGHHGGHQKHGSSHQKHGDRHPGRRW